MGTNTLTQTARKSDGICVGEENSEDLEKLTIQGDGSLNVTGTFCGILTWGAITVNGGTIISAGTDVDGYGYGIYSIRSHVVINGGNVTATDTKCAIKSTSFSVAEGMIIQASTTVDGELGEYVAENHNSYKKIVITPIPMGDINADGKFNVADVVALQKWIVCAKDAEKSIVEWKAGNFVDDDRLDAFDLSLMKRALLNS